MPLRLKVKVSLFKFDYVFQPNEKEMLARFKCNENKNASLSAVEPKIENFVNDSDNREIPSADFVGSIKAILKEATGKLIRN